MPDLPPIKNPAYLRDLRSCLQQSQHLNLLAGLMAGRGVRFVHVEGESETRAPWAAIVVQGEPDITVLRGVAAAIEAKLDEERVRLREEALKG